MSLLFQVKVTSAVCPSWCRLRWQVRYASLVSGEDGKYSMPPCFRWSCQVQYAPLVSGENCKYNMSLVFQVKKASQCTPVWKKKPKQIRLFENLALTWWPVTRLLWTDLSQTHAWRSESIYFKGPFSSCTPHPQLAWCEFWRPLTIGLKCPLHGILI